MRPRLWTCDEWQLMFKLKVTFNLRQRQVELLKQRWQKADEAETEAMAVTCATWQTVGGQGGGAAHSESSSNLKSRLGKAMDGRNGW